MLSPRAYKKINKKAYTNFISKSQENVKNDPNKFCHFLIRRLKRHKGKDEERKINDKKSFICFACKFRDEITDYTFDSPQSIVDAFVYSFNFNLHSVM